MLGPVAPTPSDQLPGGQAKQYAEEEGAWGEGGGCCTRHTSTCQQIGPVVVRVKGANHGLDAVVQGSALLGWVGVGLAAWAGLPLHVGGTWNEGVEVEGSDLKVGVGTR